MSDHPVITDYLSKREDYTAFLERYTRDSEMAQDLYQTGFEKLSHLVSADPTRAVSKSFVFVVLRNLFFDYVIAEKKHREILLQNFQKDLQWDSPEDFYVQHADESALFSCLGKALQMISAKNHSLLILYYFNEMTTKEIAAELSASVEAIRTRLHRARLELKEAMLQVCDSDNQCDLCALR